jgi:hypothetical protein
MEGASVFLFVEMRDAKVGVHVEGDKGAVMRWVGLHIKAKGGRGRLRDGGDSKENICILKTRISAGSRFNGPV